MAATDFTDFSCQRFVVTKIIFCKLSIIAYDKVYSKIFELFGIYWNILY